LQTKTPSTEVERVFVLHAPWTIGASSYTNVLYECDR